MKVTKFHSFSTTAPNVMNKKNPSANRVKIKPWERGWVKISELFLLKLNTASEMNLIHK